MQNWIVGCVGGLSLVTIVVAVVAAVVIDGRFYAGIFVAHYTLDPALAQLLWPIELVGGAD